MEFFFININFNFSLVPGSDELPDPVEVQGGHPGRPVAAPDGAGPQGREPRPGDGRQDRDGHLDPADGLPPGHRHPPVRGQHRQGGADQVRHHRHLYLSGINLRNVSADSSWARVPPPPRPR